MKLHEIQSSVRQEGSISRSLSNEFIRVLQNTRGEAHYKKRDVGINPPGYPTDLWTLCLTHKSTNPVFQRNTAASN